MASIGLGVGKYNKWVTLFHAPETQADAEFTPLNPSGAWCAIRPVTAANGRVTEHFVEMLYHPEVTIDTRIIYEDPARPTGKTTRELFVRGVQDIEEANISIRLICEEIAR